MIINIFRLRATPYEYDKAYNNLKYGIIISIKIEKDKNAMKCV